MVICFYIFICYCYRCVYKQFEGSLFSARTHQNIYPKLQTFLHNFLLLVLIFFFNGTICFQLLLKWVACAMQEKMLSGMQCIRLSCLCCGRILRVRIQQINVLSSDFSSFMSKLSVFSSFLKVRINYLKVIFTCSDWNFILINITMSNFLFRVTNIHTSEYELLKCQTCNRKKKEGNQPEWRELVSSFLVIFCRCLGFVI